MGEKFYRSYYFEETAVIYTPSEQLMSVIHQQDAFMRHCRGNIMLTGWLFYLSNMNQQTCRESENVQDVGNSFEKNSGFQSGVWMNS